MKNTFALAICLATFNAFASESEVTVQETAPAVECNSELQAENIQAIVITMNEARAILNSDQGQEFLAANGTTIDQVLADIVNLFNENQNVDGIIFTINDTTYIIKASEFAQVEEVVLVEEATDATLEIAQVEEETTPVADIVEVAQVEEVTIENNDNEVSNG